MAQMSAAAAPQHRPADRAPMRQRPFEGLGRTGFVIVAIVALIGTMKTTVRFVVSQPFTQWFGFFLVEYGLEMLVGIAILLAAVWARNRHPAPGRSQYVATFVAVTIATGLAILAITLATDFPPDEETTPAIFVAALATDLLRHGGVGLIIASAWLYTRTEADHAAAIAQCAVDSARMDEQAAAARLQMLEAQIEPHFLFNTLAHVKRLYEIDAEAGARMLANLKAYLAVALPQMRANDSTLGRELDHAQAYLQIQQIRMGHRLAFAFHVDEALRTARMPALMLVTLVENAIKHGLAPQPGSGRVDVSATHEGRHLRVVVADTGQGFTRSGGGGTGLANIRARLATQFGRDASLALALNTPRGVVATIEVPYVPADTLSPRS